LPDTTAEVKRILARALRELEHVIDNAGVRSLLRELGGILGVEHDGVTATTKPVSRRAARAKPKPVAAPRASTARVAPVQQDTTAQASPRTRTPAKPRAAASARELGCACAPQEQWPRPAPRSGRGSARDHRCPG